MTYKKTLELEELFQKAVEVFQVTHQSHQFHPLVVFVYHIVIAVRNHGHRRRREGWIRNLGTVVKHFIRDSNCASDGTLILVADVLFITLDSTLALCPTHWQHRGQDKKGTAN